jgi:DNA invertase Pin-like site-specific DNA recombinase
LGHLNASDVGCALIFEDQGLSGAFAERPALNEALAAAGEGDTFVVYRLDRLGRLVPHLISVIDGF